MTSTFRSSRFVAVPFLLAGSAACRTAAPAPAPAPRAAPAATAAAPAPSTTAVSAASPAPVVSTAPVAAGGASGGASGTGPAALTPVPFVAAEAEQSEPYPNMYRKAGLNAGVSLFANFDTTVQVSGDAGVGAVLDLEDFLDVDENYLVARGGAFWSFSKRHRIDVAVYNIRRDGTETLADDIEIGDEVIPAGEVHTTIDTLIVKAAYRYNFVADERTALGVSFGLHTMGIDLGFESTSFAVDEQFRATAPLPVIGLHGEYALGEHWKLLGSIELFQIDLGFAKGHLADNNLALENDLFDHVGWGIALNGFQLDAELEDGSLNGDLEYAYQGVFLYLRLYL